MFLSVQAITEGKRYLSRHIQGPFDRDKRHGFIGATGWIFDFNKKLLAHGEDSHLEFITGGQSGWDDLTPQQQVVHKHLVKRTVIDGFIAPSMDAVLKRVVGKSVQGNVIIELVGPTQWTKVMDSLEKNPSNLPNVLYDVSKEVIFVNGLQACYQDALSGTCKEFLRISAKALGITKESLAKRLAATIGQKGAAYLLPYIGQIYAVYDNAGLAKTFTGIVLTVDDFLNVNQKIAFDVKFGVGIHHVLPTCVTNETDKIYMTAMGVTPTKQYIVFGDYNNPEVIVGGEKLTIEHISEPATTSPEYWKPPTDVFYDISMNKYDRYITVLLSDEEKASIGDGMQSLKLTDKEDTVTYSQYLEFGIKSSLLNSLVPSTGIRGTEVLLKGCGFSTKKEDNSVIFPCDIKDCPDRFVKAAVKSANRQELNVIVPDVAITGNVYVSSKFDSQTITSNTQKFTVDVDDCNGNNNAPEICDDGIDNDCNGQTDCDDIACANDAACQSSTIDCSKEYETYHELELTLNRYCGFTGVGLICSRYNFSGCANACVTTNNFPPDAAGIFNPVACSSYPGYVSCASSAFNAYIGCLEMCNADFLNGEWGTEMGKELYIMQNVCAPQCQDNIFQLLDNQCYAQ
jgi:hypothetical protein